MAAVEPLPVAPSPIESPIDGDGLLSANSICQWSLVKPPPNCRAGDSTLHSLDCFAKSPEPHILHVYPDTGAAQGKARELKLQDSVSVASFHQKDIIHFNDGVVVNAKGRLWLAEIDKKAMAYGTNKLPSSYGEPKGRL
ncbi:uncharacterized protein PADG_11039 [Paracoccidioides brasiliensis Pb18]|uniref:SMP-30/Gluconolactonase/LRE-like region domain-containing protein n=1 Tax=Paracoccidioides brasiliensis (strain Pb18) TaxID=502780 RepID=A0A0A0HTS1_PARBD|nr:uncharacterized protein PADG_11039 [Paracoccidioides brasiliensis Pb18]KGM92594.1 hypothetical protein PADG_11039 [Paracoccidioides brasiliensis Pb18]